MFLEVLLQEINVDVKSNTSDQHNPSSHADSKNKHKKTPALFHPTFKAYLAITVMIYP